MVKNCVQNAIYIHISQHHLATSLTLFYGGGGGGGSGGAGGGNGVEPLLRSANGPMHTAVDADRWWKYNNKLCHFKLYLPYVIVILYLMAR